MSPKRAEKLGRIERELDCIIASARAMEKRYAAQLDQLHPDQLRSGRNLLHYLALRRSDVRELQGALAREGLSSLGHLEANVLSGLYGVRHAVRALRGLHGKRGRGPVTAKQGRKLLKEHTRDLLGTKLKGSTVRIMVTLPVEAADEPRIVREYLEAGMNCARINCAQGTPADWERLVTHVHKARKATGRACRVFMDVSGPKLRTGPLVPGPEVLALRPKRDDRGFVTQPALALVVPDGGEGRSGAGSGRPLRPTPDPLPRVPIPPALFRQLHPGDRLSLVDARGAAGALEVEWVGNGEALACTHASLYLETGLRVSLDTGTAVEPPEGHLGALPPLDAPLVLRVGDRMVIHKDPRPGEPARRDDEGAVLRPAHVACTLPEVLDDVRPGEAVVLDDGKARGVIRAVRPGEVEVEITQARPEGSRIRGAKGINFPESRLRMAGLTPQDKEDLRFIVSRADGVSVSFVNHPDDVEDLLDELESMGGHHLGIILKIETLRGYQHLPGILLASMEWPSVGVMIARGDLAVESGWTHLGAIQEEILWVCEAAHVPVVWATEVLDRLAKKGMPTRSEISDVVMAERAECVMLNKGPFMVEAIRTLDAVLRSVQGYQAKKTALLPALTLEDPDPEEVGRAVGLRQGRWKGW